MTDTQQVNPQRDAEEVQNFNGHTLVLVQFSSNEETRTFVDCRTPDNAMETLVRIYENFLQNRDEGSGAAGAKEYTLEELLKFVDQLFDLSALTYNAKACGYTAHGKAWFKGKLHAYLRKQA
jgi:hypothetical protein